MRRKPLERNSETKVVDQNMVTMKGTAVSASNELESTRGGTSVGEEGDRLQEVGDFEAAPTWK